jgi:hypothetical protein
MSPAGQYSAAAALTFDPDVPGAFALSQYQHEVKAWQDSWGTGSLSNLVSATGPDGRTYLKFTGGALTGTYTTLAGVGLTVVRTRQAYVEAFVEADQVHPWPVDQWPALDSAEMSQWTLEGPLYVSDSDTPNCTLGLEINWTDDGSGSGGYVAFKPGVYRLQAAAFRITVTRPTTDYDVRIYRFHTRARRVALAHTSASGVQSALVSEVFTHG